MTGHVFISHSEKDKTFAEMLLKALEGQGIKCWIAPRDILPGGSYADAILGAIESCVCFVLVFTEHANNSGHVLREVERALKFEKNLVPIRFDDAMPSRSLDYLLATVQWLRVDTQSAKDSVQRVAEQVATCAGVVSHPFLPPGDPISNVPIGAASLPTAPGRRSFKWAIVLFLLVAIVAVGIIGRIATTRMSAPPIVVQNSPSPTVFAQPSTQPTALPITNATPNTSNGPEDVLRRYYACFEERDVAAAYGLLSSEFKEKLSFKKFSEKFSSTRRIKLDEAKIAGQDERSANIAVVLTEEDAYSRQVHWQGLTGLVREPAGWRINTTKDVKRTELPAAVGTPQRMPEKAWDRPHIYLQLANGSQTKLATDLKRQLTNSGYVVVGVETVSGNVDTPADSSELRYFTPGDSAEAQKIAHEVESFFSSSGIVAYVPEGMPYVSHSRQYEIWLSSKLH